MRASIVPMDENMTTALQAVLRSLARLGRDALLRRLRPGLEQAVVERLLGLRRLTAPPGLVDLYSALDGTETTDTTLGDIYFFPGFYLLSLQHALADYDAFTPDARWDPSWLPVFTDGGGDFYAIACNQHKATFGEVIHYRIEYAEQEMVSQSLASFFRTLRVAFETSIIYVDVGGHLEMDDLAFEKLFAEHRLSTG